MTQKKAQLMCPPSGGRLGAVKAGAGISIGVDGTICSTGGGGGGVFLADADSNIWSCNTSPVFGGSYGNFLAGKDAGLCFNGVGNVSGYNTFVGVYAGAYVTAGGYTSQFNNFIGTGAGRYSCGGYANSFLGHYAGQRENGESNVYVGRSAGAGVTGNNMVYYTIDSATVIPGLTDYNYYAVNVFAGGSANVFGWLVRANGSFTTGTAPGSSLLRSSGDITNGQTLVIPGNQVGGVSPADDVTLTLYTWGGGGTYASASFNTENVFLGSYAGGMAFDVDDSVAIGRFAGQYVGLDGEFSHTFIGTGAGRLAYGGFYNTYIGAYAGQCAGGSESFSNIFIGTYAGMLAGNSFYQTIVGAYAGYNISNPNGWAGVGNQLFGAFSGESLTAAHGNSFFGAYSGGSSTTGTYNSFFGVMAGGSNTVGSFNSFFGSCSGGIVTGGSCRWNNTGNRNTAFGSKTGTNLACNSSGNTLMGFKAGEGAVNGLFCLPYFGGTTLPSQSFESYLLSANCFLDPFGPNNNLQEGQEALVRICRDGSGAVCALTIIDPGLRQNTNTFACVPGSLIGGVNGVDDLTLGSQTVFSTSTNIQNNNTFLGAYSGQASQNVTRNFYAGFRAGVWGKDDSDTIAIGSYAGFCSGYHFGPLPSWVTGVNNIYLGYKSGYGGGGYNNFFVGKCSGFGTLGQYASGNIGIGSCTGYSLTDGYSNIMLGDYTGSCTITGHSNVFLGAFSGQYNTSGTENTFVGKNAGIYNTSGIQNTFISTGAGYNNTTGNHNIAIGPVSGFSLSSGSCNVLMGRFAGIGTTTGCHNIFFGTSAGASNSTGNYNVFLGTDAGAASPNLTGSGNAFIGRQAGYVTTTGCNNNFIGNMAGRSNTSGNYNNLIGYCAGYANVLGSYNNIFGFWTGRCNTTGCYNVFIGDIAGERNTTGSYNTFIGRQSGQFNTTGIRNSFFGHLAGQCSLGSWNVGVGNGALRYNSGNLNAALGHFAGGISSSPSAACNIYIGYYSGPIQGNQTGTNNIFMGFRAGCVTANSSTSSNNILIGCLAGADPVLNLTTQSNQIVLGNNSHTDAYIKVNWTVTSDERDKTCVSAVRHGLDFVNEITPVQFNWKDRETGKVTDETPRYGFIAQEVLAAEGDPAILVDDNDPENLKLRESMMTPVLVKAIQELCQKVETLEARIQTLENPTL